MAGILIVEDDPAVAAALRRILKQDYEVETAVSAEEGIACAQKREFDVVVTDLRMPGTNGLELLRKLHSSRPQLPVILMTGYHTPEAVIEAMKLGAYDYVVKPIADLNDFVALIEKAAAANSHQTRPSPSPQRESTPDTIVGRSLAMANVCKDIGRVAARPVTVLIRGETGTGKELVARALHRHSQRADQPFVIVNCVAIPETLLEDELFGHEMGAFTGAHAQRVGRFEQANHGTIFLDEIGDLNLSVQAKLLRVLEDKAIQRVGGKETIPVDVRVIAATHRDLEQALSVKTFREDLYYRLNDAMILVPPLRQRREDIPDLAHHFLEQHQAEAGRLRCQLTEEGLRFLQFQHSWPGNVRELRNVLHKAVLLAHGYPVDPTRLRQALESTSQLQSWGQQQLHSYVGELLNLAASQGSADVAATLTEWAERELYGQAIRLAGGEQTRVARWLGVSRATVYERLRHFGLHPSAAEPQKTKAS
jgi:DNA-binding NtrC family response regulator